MKSSLAKRDEKRLKRGAAAESPVLSQHSTVSSAASRRASSTRCRVHGTEIVWSLCGTPFCSRCRKDTARTIPTVPRACVQSLREDSEVRERVVAE